MIKRLAAAALWLSPATALAHPGDHSGMSPDQALQHMLTQPDHLAMLTAAAVALAGGWWVHLRRHAR